MKSVSSFFFLLLLFIAGTGPAGAAPTLVYSTPMSGSIQDLTVDSAGNAYVLVDRGSFGYCVAKLSPTGELIFLRQLGLPPTEPLAPPREPLDIAIDPAGYIYVAGFADYHWECCHDDSYRIAFVAKLGPDGTGLLYDTYFWDGYNTEAHDLAVDALGRAYVRVTSRWPDKYGFDQSFGWSFSPAGSPGGGFGAPANPSWWWSWYVNAIALGPSGDRFGVGWRYSEHWAEPTAYLSRTDAFSGAVVETVLDDTDTVDPMFDPLDVAGAPGGGAVVVGKKSGGIYVARFGPAGEEVFSRMLNPGTVIFDVAVASSGQIVLAGYTWSGGQSPIVLRLDGGTGEVLSSMPGGWSVAVGPGGDVYVAMNGGVSRFTENWPPNCTAATASPSTIWPPDRRQVRISTLGVIDPNGDPVTLKVTRILQDELFTARMADAGYLGTAKPWVRADRMDNGDGRVYHLFFEATDPAGAKCTGVVTVCVPLQSGGTCGDGGARIDSTLPR